MANSSSALLRTVQLQKYDSNQPLLGAEIGVYEGSTSTILLRAFPNLCLLMVDWWQDCGGSHYVTDPDKHVLQAKHATDEFSDRRVLMMGDSVLVAKYIPDGILDWVYIDGDHTYAGARRDLEAWVPKVKQGGWIWGHDYFDNTKRPAAIGRRKRGVKIAVDEFVAAGGYELLVRSRQTYEFRQIH